MGWFQASGVSHQSRAAKRGNAPESTAGFQPAPERHKHRRSTPRGCPESNLNRTREPGDRRNVILVSPRRDEGLWGATLGNVKTFCRSSATVFRGRPPFWGASREGKGVRSLFGASHDKNIRLLTPFPLTPFPPLIGAAQRPVTAMYPLTAVRSRYHRLNQELSSLTLLNLVHWYAHPSLRKMRLAYRSHRIAHSSFPILV